MRWISSAAIAIGLLAIPVLVRAAEWGPLHLLEQDVPPGAKARLSFITEDSFIKEALDMNVLVARGARPGPTLCLAAAVHGDEVNGVEIVRRALDETEPEVLSGTLVAVPIVNVWGFRSGNRYLADRRDLNRSFPGKRRGSLGSRIAWHVFEKVIRHCDALLDLHTGSNRRANLPQVRTGLGDERAAALAEHFGVGIVLDGTGPTGSLRRAAVDAGIPAIIYEAGEPNRFEREEIKRGIEGVRNAMEQLEMVGEDPPAVDPQRIFRSSTWVRAEGGGIFLTDRALGDKVETGELLGTVTDPVTNQRFEIRAPVAGILVGSAHPRVVLPGFALFHIARHEQATAEASETEE
jgi:predicted deacylase